MEYKVVVKVRIVEYFGADEERRRQMLCEEVKNVQELIIYSVTDRVPRSLEYQTNNILVEDYENFEVL
jgi:hypothetical protein